MNLAQYLDTATDHHLADIESFLRHFRDDVDSAPAAAALERFFDLARRLCRTSRKQAAIDNLAKLGSTPLPSHFPCLNKGRVAYQLARRVLKPTLFNQGNFGFCGPVAFVQTECEVDPSGFTRFVVQLFEQGKGQLKGRWIAPAAQIRNFNPARHGITEADFLVLASIRASDAPLDETVNVAAYDGTGLMLLYKWFVQAGYAQVVMIMTSPPINSGRVSRIAYSLAQRFSREQCVRCHPDARGMVRLGGLDPTDKRRVLEIACFYCLTGWKIMLAGLIGIATATPLFDKARRIRNDSSILEAIRGTLATQFEEQARKTLVAESGQHWVVARRMEIRGECVLLEIVSWAQVSRTETMPIDAFLAAFTGFVAAYPVPQDNTGTY